MQSLRLFSIFVLFHFGNSMKFVIQQGNSNENNLSGSTQLFENSANWDKYTDAAYPFSLAKTDLGSVTGWVDSRARTSGGTLRITLEKDAIRDEGGVQANVPLPVGTAYELDFDVKFHSNFNWSRGGKVGFGLKIGNGNTGCKPPLDGAGGSLRMMWYQNNNGRVYFHPYVYYVDMPGSCGENFGKTYPTTGKQITV